MISLSVCHNHFTCVLTSATEVLEFVVRSIIIKFLDFLRTLQIR